MKKIITVITLIAFATGCATTPPAYSGYENICYNVGSKLSHDENDREAASKLITEAEQEPGYNQEQCTIVARQAYQDVKAIQQAEQESSTDWAGIAGTTLQVIGVVLMAAAQAQAEQDKANAEWHRQVMEEQNRKAEIRQTVRDEIDNLNSRFPKSHLYY